MSDYVDITKKGGNYEACCKKGLWSISGPTRDEVERQAYHYFFQYILAGEYTNILYKKFEE